MSYVDMRESIPEWAADYAVGETILLRHPDDGPTPARIAGFSSHEDYRGLPVIDGRPFTFGGGSLALSEHNIVESTDS
ncbi:hypothetical protein [Halomarina oriensis]|uniref:Uncharacterized protein n=1 Tax=Halomarina oriensis TaxID=671145 RepID=A0A6B0GV76_9EURY|nr:hypothetical protein [Halomarina oriensis]MWG36483.1 hypothetical protein [Halomarina oriensis]